MSYNFNEYACMHCKTNKYTGSIDIAMLLHEIFLVVALSLLCHEDMTILNMIDTVIIFVRVISIAPIYPTCLQ